MYSEPIKHKSAELDQALGAICSEPNPELEEAVKTAARGVLLDEFPTALNIEFEFISTLDGASPSSERAVFNHYGFVVFLVKAHTHAGKVIHFSGQYDTNLREVSFSNIKS